MIETAAAQMIRTVHVRKASECLKSGPEREDDLHRSAHAGVIDYRLQEITYERARAFATLPGFAADKPHFSSPWHYHDCELQLAVVLAGSVEFAFEAECSFRCAAGDIAFIPGFAVHDVVEPSADYVVAELTFPGSFSTIEAPPPVAGSGSIGRVLSIATAVRSTCERGMVSYRHELAPPFNEKFDIQRERRSRVSHFAPATLTHGDDLRIMLVTQGTREIAIDSDVHVLREGDLLVQPQGAECEDRFASEDFQGLWVRMLR